MPAGHRSNYRIVQVRDQFPAFFFYFLYDYNLQFLKKIRSLTDLSLTSNNLANLPEEIGDLTQLIVLRIDDNRLTSLPESIGRLSLLEELQAGQNRLSKLPTSIGLLRKLETLMLNENLLDELPVELGSCQRLTVLSLRKNRLEHLPPEMGHLSRLRVINLSCNRLVHLPVSFLKLPSLSALWLSEAQTKPVVPLQTDTDSSTGRKVLTCFLLPQSSDLPEEQQTSSSDKDNSVVAARSPTHIKFAFDGEADHRAGKLMRNPTPYPKELKALAKHAQHIQQHHPVSPTSRPSVDLTAAANSPTSGEINKKIPAEAPAVVTTPSSSKPIEPTVVAKISNDSSAAAIEPTPVPMRHKAEVAPPPEPCSQVPPLEYTTSPLPAKRMASVENLLSCATTTEEQPEQPAGKTNGVPELSPRSAEIEIKEARVLRPLMSGTDGPSKEEHKVKNSDAVDRSSQLDLTASDTAAKQQPPPYHVAAAYSKRAAEFNHAANLLPRTQSTDSGFTVDGAAGGEKRDSSPSRDSGRGPSIEPLEDTAQPTPAAAVAPIQPAAPPKRPIDLALNGNGLLDKEKATPLMLKRATYIIDRSLSPTANGEAEEPGDLQSVAALRQAAREVFLSSPRESPLPTHKQSVWDVPLPVHTSANGPTSTLSAAHVLGLPPAGNVSENAGQQQQQPANKIQGRLPPPKYHVPASNGFRDSPTELLKSPPPANASSRIPLASHNRLPSGLARQLSNLSNSSQLDSGPSINKPVLPPKQRDSSPPPPTLLPKLSTSRIPPPQVHTPPVAPLTPLSTKQTFSPLPVHSARMVTPTTTTPISPTTNNNDFDANQSNKSLSSSQLNTRIPLPKYSAADINKVAAAAGPSPGSRIPTRLPAPTVSLPSVPKSKLSADLTASPSLAAYTPRIQ